MSSIDKDNVVYNGQLDAFELYHLILEDADKSSRNGGPALPALGHALAGSVATATSKLLIYPLDLVIARLQVQKQLRDPSATEHDEYKGVLDAARKIYQHEGGVGAFYTGCAAEVAKGITDSFLFFLAYSFLQQYETKRAAAKKQQISVVREMGIGIASGAFSKLITTPLQNIITRQQTAALLKAKDTKNDTALKRGDALTVSDIARQIYKERGIQGFWAGYSLSLILTLNPAITFAVDGFLQKANRFSDSAHITFLIAAVSKAIATSITYPISVAKSRAQAMPHSKTSSTEGTDKTGPPRSGLLKLLSAQYAVFVSLQNIYKREGLSGLYSGLEGEVVKGFLTHGLTMMVKDRVHVGIIELYYFLLKATSQWPHDLRQAQSLAASVVVDARQRVENVGVTLAEGGKNALSDTQDRVADASKQILQRAENVGTSMTEAGKTAVNGMNKGAASLVAGGASAISSMNERVGNVTTTLVEGGKTAASDIGERAAGLTSSTIESGQAAAADASERVSNLSTTIVEGGKSAVENVGERAAHLTSSAVEGGKTAATDISGRAADLTSSAIEGGKAAAADVGERASNISTTVVEAGKTAASNVQDTNYQAILADVNERAMLHPINQARQSSSSVISGAKNAMSNASKTANSIGDTVVQRGKDIAADVQDRATTIADGSRNVVKKSS